jgi:hypothetical protein
MRRPGTEEWSEKGVKKEERRSGRIELQNDGNRHGVQTR